MNIDDRATSQKEQEQPQEHTHHQQQQQQQKEDLPPTNNNAIVPPPPINTNISSAPLNPNGDVIHNITHSGVPRSTSVAPELIHQMSQIASQISTPAINHAHNNHNSNEHKNHSNIESIANANAAQVNNESNPSIAPIEITYVPEPTPVVVYTPQPPTLLSSPKAPSVIVTNLPKHIERSGVPSASPVLSGTNNGNNNSNNNNDGAMNIRSGHFCDQGFRQSMEDEMVILERFNVQGSTSGPYSLYGVFDGHGGRNAAIYTKTHLQTHIQQQLAHNQPPAQALINAFHATDSDFLASESKDHSGTTAVVCLIDHAVDKLWIAHVGDSRAVLYSDGKVIALSSDHKADRPDELARIRLAGGFVIHKRVMGELAISRAIGDADFKDQIQLVISTPEIYEHTLSSKDEVLLLACDGLYDVLSNEQAIEYIHDHLNHHHDPNLSAQGVVQYAIRELNTRDNVTCIIVTFKTF